MYSLIVYCGMDGSGKTTSAKSKFIVTDNSILLHADKYTFRINKARLSDKVIRKFGYLLIPFCFVCFLDNLYTYFRVYKPILKKRRLILDRYFYDKVARLVFYGVCPRWLARIWIKCLPRPQEINIFINPIIIKDEIEEHDKWIEVYTFIKRILDE